MEIYDANGNLLTGYDETLGKLVPSTRTVVHDAVPEVPEIWHWDEKTHPNGGVSRRRVFDQKGIPGREAWVEEKPILIYIPYTQEELEALEAEKNKPTDAERLTALEEKLAAYEAAYAQGVNDA